MNSGSLERFRSLNKEQLRQEIDGLQKQLFELRVQVVTQHVPAYATQKRALRKSVAQAQTVYRQLQEEGGHGR